MELGGTGYGQRHESERRGVILKFFFLIFFLGVSRLFPM